MRHLRVASVLLVIAPFSGVANTDHRKPDQRASALAHASASIYPGKDISAGRRAAPLSAAITFHDTSAAIEAQEIQHRQE